MKKRNLFFAGIMGIAVSLTSCGNHEHKSEETKEVEVVKEEVKVIEMNINTTESAVMWKGEMLGMYSHEGTLNFTSGNVEITNGIVTGGNFTVDMTTMKATDENYKPEDGKTPEKLVGHLSSPDFFDVAQFPTASFTVTGGEGNTVTGTLTLKGKAGEETVNDVTVSEEGGKTTLTGTLTVNRKNYDVSFDHPAKEMVLSDDIVLNVKLVAGM